MHEGGLCLLPTEPQAWDTPVLALYLWTGNGSLFSYQTQNRLKAPEERGGWWSWGSDFCSVRPRRGLWRHGRCKGAAERLHVGTVWRVYQTEFHWSLAV